MFTSYRLLFSCIFSLFLLMGGCSSIVSHFSDDRKRTYNEKIEQYDQLIKNGKKTIAIYDTVYKSTQLAKTEIGVDIKYTFIVADTEYTGNASLQHAPTEPVTTVYYNPVDPSINSIDPEKDKKTAENTKTSSFNLYFGLFLLLAGLGSANSSWNKYKDIKQKEVQEAAELEAELQEFNRKAGIN